MTGILRRRRTSSLLDKFLRRRAQRQDTVCGTYNGDCARTALAEMIAAAAVLDFGAFPLEAMIPKSGARFSDDAT
jgi:hypothetical protein